MERRTFDPEKVDAAYKRMLAQARRARSKGIRAPSVVGVKEDEEKAVWLAAFRRFLRRGQLRPKKGSSPRRYVLDRRRA